MIKRNEISLLFVIFFCSIMAQNAVENFSLVGIKKINISQKRLYYNIDGKFPTYWKIFDYNNQSMIDLLETNVITEAYLNGIARYGISSAINVFVNIPFMRLTRYSQAIKKKNRGFGDIEIGGVYQILGKSLTETTLNIQLSIITPTGENKNLAPSEIPLGIGAWQTQGKNWRTRKKRMTKEITARRGLARAARLGLWLAFGWKIIPTGDTAKVL